MNWTTCVLLVLLIFIGSADNKDSEKEFNTTLAGDSLDIYIERHRNKRALFGDEHQFFKTYYDDTHRLREYCDARQNNGRIYDWKRLGAYTYTDAIRRSTSYYATQAKHGQTVDSQISMVKAIIKYRNETAFTRYNGPDEGHSFTIQEWRRGLEKIEVGKKCYEERSSCRQFNVRKKRGFPLIFATIPLWAKVFGLTSLFGVSIGTSAALISDTVRHQSSRRSYSSRISRARTGIRRTNTGSSFRRSTRYTSRSFRRTPTVIRRTPAVIRRTRTSIRRTRTGSTFRRSTRC